MNRKKALGVFVGSSIGLGGIAGAAVTAVACGSTTTFPLATYVYKYTQGSLNWSGKTGKDLIVWLSYSINQTQQVDRVTPALSTLFENAGYTVKIVADATTNYANAATTLSSLLAAKDYDNMPDVILNYPDIQAILESVGLAQDFDEAPGTKLSDLIVPGLQFDISSVFTSKPGAYAVPFFKSTDLLYFNLPAFAMLLNDIASLQPAGAVLKVKANSPQQRMIKAILATQTLDDPHLENIYAPDPTTSYLWSDLAAAWQTKTSAGGVWESDSVELQKNFVLNNDKKSMLTSINWENDIFGSYDELKTLLLTIANVYAPQNDARALAIDTVSNTIYSYQYDLAGHKSENFFIHPLNSVDPPRMAYDFSTDSTVGKSLVAATDYISSLINAKALFVQTTPNVYSSTLFMNNQSFLAQSSSNSATYVTTAGLTGENNERSKLNPGDVYFDVQPTKASASETSNTIINQGPSLFVTKAHPAESVAIAGLLRDAFADGTFGAKYNATSGSDDGVFGPLGYIYPDKTSQDNNGSYVSALNAKVASSENWRFFVAKYLLAKYLDQPGDSYGSFNNPAVSNTTLIRNWFNEVYKSYFANGSAPSGVDALSRIVQVVVPDAHLSALP